MTFREFANDCKIGVEIHVERLLEELDIDIYQYDDFEFNAMQLFYKRAREWDDANIYDKLYLDEDDMRISIDERLICFMQRYGYDVNFEIFKDDVPDYYNQVEALTSENLKLRKEIEAFKIAQGRYTPERIVEGNKSEVVVKPIKSLF